MLDPMNMLRAAGQTFSLTCGSMGVFVLIASFQAPSLLTSALVLLAIATVTMLVTINRDDSGPKPKNGRRRPDLTRTFVNIGNRSKRYD